MKERTVERYPAHDVTRREPVNLVDDDRSLFVHEFSKTLPAATVEVLTDVDILADAVFNHRKLVFYFQHTCHYRVARRVKAKRLLLYLTRKATLDRGIWIIDNFSVGYFHWVTDALPRLVAAAPLMRDHAVVLPEAYEQIQFSHQSLHLLGVKVHFFDPDKRLRIRKLIMTSHTAPTGNYNRTLIRTLRSRFETNSALPGRKIYVSRAKATRRKITNEKDVCALMESCGYEVHHFEDYDFAKQVALLQQTSHLAGLHGAGLTNMLFMPEGGKVLELRNQSDAHNNCYFSLAADLGHDYYYLLGAGTTQNTYVVDVTVDLDRLRAVIEQMAV